jgi:hypothetical protein
MHSGKPAVISKSGIENFTEQLRRYDISCPRTETLYSGTAVMPKDIKSTGGDILILTRENLRALGCCIA